MELVDGRMVRNMVRVIEELKDRVETLELSNDSQFMNSLEKSEKEVAERDFADWDEL